jgi:hypothetical protein
LIKLFIQIAPKWKEEKKEICLHILHIMSGFIFSGEASWDQKRGIEPRIWTTELICIGDPSQASAKTICSVSTSLATLPLSLTPRFKYLHHKIKKPRICLEKLNKQWQVKICEIECKIIFITNPRKAKEKYKPGTSIVPWTPSNENEVELTARCRKLNLHVIPWNEHLSRRKHQKKW